MDYIADSDVGMKRKNNEDSYYINMLDNDSGIYIVADGLGGYSCGEVASDMLTKEVAKYIEERSRWLKNVPDEKIKYVISEAIKCANEQIFNLSQSSSQYKGMGTTATLVYKQGERIFYASIGDSRIYHLDLNLTKLEQITIDDTYVNELVKTNVISEDEAKSHPQKHMLTKAVGVSENIEVEVKDILLSGGYLILCTDGMSNMLSDTEIINIFKSTKFDDVASNIIVKANENGGADNITVVVVKL